MRAAATAGVQNVARPASTSCRDEFLRIATRVRHAVRAIRSVRVRYPNANMGFVPPSEIIFFDVDGPAGTSSFESLALRTPSQLDEVYTTIMPTVGRCDLRFSSLKA